MTSFGSVVHEPGGHYGPRFQDRYELLFLRSGSLTAYVDEMKYQIAAGQVMLLRPGHKEWLKFSDTCRSARDWTTLRPEFVPSPVISRIGLAPVAVDLSPEMDALVNVALGLPDTITPMTGLVLDKIALALVANFVRKAESSTSTDNALPTAVVKSLEYMELHLSQQISLKDIAAAACVTPHHLIKVFNQYLSTTPVKYLWQMRMQRSGELLRTTALSISEIAYLVGYQSPFHFSRSFKLAYGKSPKSHREMLWSEQKNA